jgi:Insulin-induced protein (INSIG)
MTELKYFPLLSGGTAALMGSLLPMADHYYSEYVEEQRRKTKTENDPKYRPLWESAEWSMPMRYIGGVVGFAWAVSVCLLKLHI